jgi:phosphoglycolate phosphatase
MLDGLVSASMADPRPLSTIRSELAAIRVVYTDLDGTMLGPAGSFVHDPKGEPTSEPVRALTAAHRAGIEIVPTSGRALRGLLTDARLLGLGSVIAEMGALIGDDFGRTVLRRFGDTPVEGDELPARTMERVGAVDLILERFGDRLEFHMPWSAWRECTQLFRGRVDVTEVDEALSDSGLEWLTLHDNGRLHGAYLGLAQGESRAYHLIPRGVSKGKGVEAHLEHRGWSSSEAIAIGDAYADLQLADATAWCVIVGDALRGDDVLHEACVAHERVVVTRAPQNLGWVELIDAIVAAKG